LGHSHLRRWDCSGSSPKPYAAVRRRRTRRRSSTCSKASKGLSAMSPFSTRPRRWWSRLAPKDSNKRWHPRGAWAGAALGPAAGDLVLLADAGLVGEPDFYRVAVKRLLARNCLQE